MSASRVIAIDGPAAAGKGTLARRLAAAIGLPYLDTGLLYRAVARRMLDAGADAADPVAAEAQARALVPADLERTNLRVPEIDRAAAAVAAIPSVRAALLSFQRSFGTPHGAVLDGRDIGTIIFPDAGAKFFVTASVDARAKRRWAELCARGIAATLDTVQKDMQARDASDASRAAAPLIAADNAVMLDTTDLTADAAFEAAMRVLEGQGWRRLEMTFNG